MKLYVIMDYLCYEPGEVKIVGIFTTRDKAEEYLVTHVDDLNCKVKEKRWNTNDFPIEESFIKD